MFENILSHLSNGLQFLTSHEAFQGFLGIFIFLCVVLLLTWISSQVTGTRLFWFVELMIGPALVYAASQLIMVVLDFVAISEEVSGRTPLLSVPLIMLTAYLINRALRLFLWEGLLARSAVIVPRIVWNIGSVFVYVVAVYLVLAWVYNQPMTGFVVSSGIVVGVVGLAFQPILGDVISGIGLTIERPFTTGDWIELEDGSMGEVIKLDWRATEIKIFNNTVHVIPNGKLANTAIQNYDRPDKVYGFWFYVTVTRSVPPTLVRRLLLEAALKSKSVLDDPRPVIRVWDADEKPIRYLVFLHCSNYRDNFLAKDEVLTNAWSLFTRAGFNFAASPRDIEVRRGDRHDPSELEAELLLKEVPLLAPLSDGDRRELAHDGVQHLFGAGETIITQDKPGGSMFVILSGMVVVNRKFPDGKVIEFARLGTYEYFGEISLLTGEARSANVIAHTECQVLEIAKQSLEPIFERRPSLAASIAEIMAERKLKNDMLSAEAKSASVSERLKGYTEAFTQSIQKFFKG